MKKFKYSMRVPVTNKQFQEIKPFLESLGYEDNEADKEGYLHTYNKVSKFQCLSIIKDKDIQLEEYDKDLILGLTAMVDDDKPHIGEYIVVINSCIGKPGSIHKITNVTNDSFGTMGDDIFQSNLEACNYYCRKATKEEIINHFKKENPVMNRKITGYKLIKKYPFWEPHGKTLTVTGWKPDGTPSNVSSRKDKAYGTLNVDPEFWEPTYSPIYNPGDKVTDDNGKNIYTFKEGRDGNLFIEENNFSLGFNHRLATPEEIEAQKIRVGKWEFEETLDGGKIGCISFSKQEASFIQYLLIKKAKLTVGGNEITLPLVDKIISKL